MAVAVTVRAFAKVREALGRGEWAVTLDGAMTAAEIRERLAREHPHAAAALNAPDLRVDVNGAIVPWETRLQDGDEIALLPPFSGG